ncbi:MAG: hypothetical protein J6Q07_05665 [Alistipes sp.]|nr:hypothetical protein [Alistipes sp.]
MKRIFITLLILGCSLTTALAQVYVTDHTNGADSFKDSEQDRKIGQLEDGVRELQKDQKRLNNNHVELKKDHDKTKGRVEKVEQQQTATTAQITEINRKQANFNEVVNIASNQINTLDERLKLLEQDISQYKATRRGIDEAYMNQSFATMSVDVLNQMHDFYAADSAMLNKIDVRIDLCKRLDTYRGLLQKDFNAQEVLSAIKFLREIKYNMDTRSEQYQLTDEHKTEILSVYDNLWAYYDGIKAIATNLIPKVRGYRSTYNNARVVSQKLSEYLA